ncbi:hypothetical protein TSUD_21400 [Trifolium subterraneum]|nr:hypothetical protein TSUD_21400 [Trifolium subterraneum]
MLLDVASEQANRELLLQKHFFALLSSVWKAAQVDRRQNLHATCNSLYFDQSFFSSIGQHSQNPLNKPSERMTYAHSGQSKMLLAAALDDLKSGPENDKIVLSNQGKDMPVTEDQVDITLEFPKEESDSLSSFPSVIKLSIKGAEAPPSLNKHTRNDHLKSCFSAAENRFREVTKACEEDSSRWASSAFPTNDARSRPGSRVQSSGKQRSSISDVIKPSRSKTKRPSVDSSELHRHQTEPLFPPMPSLQELASDLSSSTVDKFGFDTESDFPFDLNGESSLERENFGVVPHDYIAEFISGLDDCTTFPEYTDIR